MVWLTNQLFVRGTLSFDNLVELHMKQEIAARN